MSEQAQLGDRVRDPITGFTGIVTGHHKYITGCDRMSVSPPVDKDGKLADPVAFDRPTLEVIERGVVKPQPMVAVEPEPIPDSPRVAGGPPTRMPR